MVKRKSVSLLFYHTMYTPDWRIPFLVTEIFVLEKICLTDVVSIYIISHSSNANSEPTCIWLLLLFCPTEIFTGG